MSKNLSVKQPFMKRHFIGLFLIAIISFSLFVPMILIPPTTDNPPHVTPPLAEGLTLPTPIVNTVAGEPNFTRESWPFVLNNYPDFSWMNPGQFDSSTSSNGESTPATIQHTPTGNSRGYDASEPAPGVGTPAYPVIYQALEGLNESNIRIMYLDSEYEWISVPYQIDNKGWTNIWNMVDLNKFGGLDANNVYGQGGGPHVAADSTVGMGWIAGDLVQTEGKANYGTYANDLQHEWFPMPIWTYVSPRQADGSITDETLHIDPVYRDQLIWTYMDNISGSTGLHDGFLAGDMGGGADGEVNPWNMNPGGYPRIGNHRYANLRDDTWKPAFVNTTAYGGNDHPWTDSNGVTNMVFMGDTWFRTPGNYGTSPTWVQNAFPYQQINGALDMDDEICFYAYPGRQAAAWYWWNYNNFPHRFELQITDPVDGGQTWMYIYFNNESWADPFTGGVNLGEPTFTALDRNDNPTQDYISWDPDTFTLTSDYYQVSMDETNPSLVDSVSIFGDTDGQPLATAFNKMYIYGFAAEHLADEWSSALPFGREGTWYSWSSTASTSFSELVAFIDNPSVLYPEIPEDMNQQVTYARTGELTADKRSPASTAPTNPQNYQGPRGVAVNGMPPYTDLEVQGDGRAVVDGPCRIIFYTQQFVVLGLYVEVIVSGTDIIVDDVDLAIPIMNGPSLYYRRVQRSPDASIAIPGLPGFEIQIYYAYVMCGNVNPDIRDDVTFTAATEWSGGVDDDGDNNIPTFGWADGEGWTKQGGLNPQTTTYTILGTSTFDGVSNDYYGSQGDPLINNNPNPGNPLVCPPDGNNLNIPDWAMATSDTHGSIWLYIPVRELTEIKDNIPFDFGGAGVHGSGWYGQPKLYFRDDQYQAEFGVCLDGGQSPYVQGGTETSPYKMMMVYDDYTTAEAATVGHLLYLYYYFPLEGAGSFALDPAPAAQFLYDYVTPDKLVYNTGDTIRIDIAGVPENTAIDADFTDIDASDPIVPMLNDTSGEWYINYNLDVLDGAPTNYERIIQFTADCLEPFYTTDSVYDLTVTIDTVAPTGASYAAIPDSTAEAFVLLDWSASPGSDVGCASVANPSGIGHYRLRRGPSIGTYDTIIADDVPITTTQFLDSFVQNGETYYYVIDTYDEVGNMATSSWDLTTITLPYTPAQPDDLPPTTLPSFTLDWTANPGYGSGVTITGYEVHYATNTDGSYPDIGSYALAPGGNVGLATTWTAPASLTEATYYFLVVRTMTAGVDLFSSPVFTRADTVAPWPAELATPLPTYDAEKEEIIVSWAIETLPQYQSGGFPGQDLNGIDHWVVYKRVAAGNWFELATVPYGATTVEQRVLDISVSDGVTYSYSLESVDGAGNSALCLVNKTTTLNVIGPGVAEVFSVVASTSEVQQGQQNMDITVVVRNPGASGVTLNTVQLLFKDGSTDVTSDYSGVTQNPAAALAAGTNATYVFTVDVSQTATIGAIDILGETTYDGTETSVGAIYPDSWLVLPNASIQIQTITSSYVTVHPGEQDIPVRVQVKNVGTSNATLETLQLTFTRDSTDISDKFMVELLPSQLPSTPFTGTLNVDLNVTVSQSITMGGVIIDASITGSASGVPLSDSGAVTPKTWAVSTWPKPVIANVVADKSVYWAPPAEVITLTVTADIGGHTVKAYFGNVDSGAGNETASNPGAGITYIITHTLTTPVGEATYDVIVYAENASGTSTYILPIRLGQAPTFSNWAQSPGDGAVDTGEIVDIDIDINDNGGANDVAAYLIYRVDGGSWIQRSMSYAGAAHWDVTIPSAAAGAYVEYIVNASDLVGNWATYSESYSVNTPPEVPILIEGSEIIHAQGDQGTTYNETVGFGAPLDATTEYTASIDTSWLPADDFYTVLVSAFDPIRNSYINISTNVWLQQSVPLASM